MNYMSYAQRLLAAQEGYEFNQYNGVYKNGAKYDHRKKLEVAAFYLELQEASGGASPSITAVAQGCKVSRDYVRTVEKELQTQGTILSDNDAPPRNCDRGFGVHTLDNLDMFVLINPIHCGGANSDIEDWLWDEFRILVLFLPPRSPELNPIELVWNQLVQKLKLVPLDVMRNIGANSVAIVSEGILQQMSHEDVEGTYHHAGVIR